MNDARCLNELFAREWDAWMVRYPTWASTLGDRRFNDRWDDLSLDAVHSWRDHLAAVIRELDAFDSHLLTPQDALNRELLRLHHANEVEEHDVGLYCLALTQRDGPQTAAELGTRLRFETTADFEDWIGRVTNFPRYLDQIRALLAEGMKRRIVHPRIVMERVPRQLEAQLVEPEESPFLQPFRRFAGSVPLRDQEKLATAATAAIRTLIVPAFRRFLHFFVEEYLPSCFAEVGIWQVPGGEEIYRFLVRQHTTRDLTPDEVHEIGLAEVARIKGEMQDVIRGLGFSGSLAEFFDFLRTDPRFYYATPQELLAAYRALCKRIDPCLVRLFGTLPRMPYGVEPIPDATAPDTTTAYYGRPAADGSRAGTYYVNLYRPETRPRYEMVPLSLHEAVPGHHLQIALAMEQGDLPAFRRHLPCHAYTEGWALYAESLGEVMGLYDDPYDQVGRLAFAMWRAARLVIDTGIHRKRWTRDQGIAFLRECTPKAELDIVNEVDRYIAWPGQALSYAIGEITIRQVRGQAEEALGDGFDLRLFHDAILSTGAVPMDVLARHMEKWISERSGKESA